MPLYGNLIYGSGATYGQAPSLPYSVEPLTARALWYDSILLNWVPSQSNFKEFRLLRNQKYMPESPEDGIMLIQWNTEDPDSTALATQSSYLDTAVIDGVEIPGLKLTQGRYAYYRVWLLTDLDIWVVAGETAVLLPKQASTGASIVSTTHSKLMELLPRQFTSSDRSVYGGVDYTTDLAVFLEAFSFTFDEYLTFSDIIQANAFGEVLSPSILALQAYQVGVPAEYQNVTKIQQKLIREAIYIYQRKGTSIGLSTFAESTTGYAPTVNTSPNLLLSMEDSSFYKGVGNWESFGDVVLTSVDSEDTDPAETSRCDTTYTGKAVITTAGASIGNGLLGKTTVKIPLETSDELTLSFYAKSATANTVTPKITWYNYLGEELSTASGSANTLTTSWAKYDTTAWPPGFEGVITSLEVVSNVVTATLTTTHPFTTSDSVIISGLNATFNGTHTITATTSTTISFNLTTSDTAITQLTADVKLASWTYDTKAKFAGIELVFGASGTVFLDYVQLAPSSFTAYYEARCVGVSLAPSKINYLKNPTFLSSGTAWTIDATSSAYVPTDVVGVYGGLTMLELDTKAVGTTTLSSETDATLEAGEFYTASIYAKSPNADQEISLTISLVDTVTSTTVDSVTTTTTLTDIWSRPSATVFLPITDNTVKAVIEITVEDSGETLNFDCAQIEQSSVATDYIDGAMPTEYYAGWYGTAHQSASFQYVNKQVRLERLTNQIEKYLPTAVSYRVITEAGVEVANITY